MAISGEYVDGNAAEKRNKAMKRKLWVATLVFGLAALGARAQAGLPGMALVPAGTFEMGDHHGFVDPKHGGDETPVHTVRLGAFYIGVNDVTTREYCGFLNAALAQKQVTVRGGGVYPVGGNDLLCETRAMSPYSRIGWDGTVFTVLDKKENHPVVCIRWAGAAAYCNWLSMRKKLPACYNTATWDCDFSRSAFRLPTEAEWEYAARGGQQQPYWNFPWADGADPAKANWPESKNPFRSGPQPWTTPVGFFDGKLHHKADFDWPGPQESFQSADGSNGYGLYDMSGNVWQFVNDWYARDYYAYSPSENPAGPASGSIMPDGKPYRGMRGGSWYNGENGHGRVSNRNPSYYRGPQDPDHPYYHIGFRVVLPVAAESRPVVRPTPVRRSSSEDRAQGAGRSETGGGGPPPDEQAGSDDQRPPRDDQGGGAPRGQGGFHLLPPRAQEQLDLTAGQQTQMDELATGVQAKLKAILTPEQQQKLAQLRPPQRQGGSGNGKLDRPAPPDEQGQIKNDDVGPAGERGPGESNGQPPDEQAGSNDERPPRDVGGGGAVPGQGWFHLLPPRAQEQLDLTADQQTQMEELATGVQSKLNAILTTEQQQKLEQFRPPQRQVGNGDGNLDRSASPHDTEQGGSDSVESAGGRRPGEEGGDGQPPDVQAQDQNNDAGTIDRRVTGFVLSSPAVADGGMLPREYTGDGASATLPLEWTGAPAGTKSYAVVMHHIPGPGTVKWYWVLYNIPPAVHSLPRNVRQVGTLGNNSVNGRTEYAPPHSKGPGPKTYIYTVYALSAPPQLDVPPARVSRAVLLAAMQGRILATAELKVVYTRQGTSQGSGAEQRAPSSSSADDRREPGRTENRQGGRRERGGGMAVPESKLPVSPNPGQTVGLFLNTPRAFKGYTLLAPKHNTITYLMDNLGRIVHSWKSNYEPGQSAHLLPDGHLLRAGMVKGPGGTGGGDGGRIEEYDWDGRMVWEFDYATRDHQLHHDIKPLPNGHIIALMVERKSREQAVAAGFDADRLRDDYLQPDAVVEIEPVLPKGGRIVWEWHVWDHLVQDSDPAKANYGNVAAHPELVDPNSAGRGIPAFWNHMNSLAYNPALDQIVLSVRGNNEIWIIDHSTTKAEASGHTGGRSGKGGDLLYRWGNPAAYRQGDARDQQLIQQHDAQWIPPGCPGAGHILIFNNGYDRGWSSVEEIVPPVDANGRYLLASGKAYGPEKPVWHYEAKNRTDFFSSEISGAHRLPNGNTLICAGVIGNLFEVTPSGETVWQYVNPVVHGGILAQGEIPGKDTRGHLWNAVFKVHRYAPDDPGLRGRDLTPKGVIELPASQKGKTGMDKADASLDNRPGEGGRNPGGQRGGGHRDDGADRDDQPGVSR